MRVIVPLLCLLSLLGPSVATARGRYYNHSSSIPTQHTAWMQQIPDGTSLATLSIPGTHDTQSLYGGDLVQTQALGVREQLDAGIRALEARCRHYQDRFVIHHGAIYQHANFDDLLGALVQFLQAHPSETILLRVKSEHDAAENTRSFTDTFLWYRSQPAYSPYIWTGTWIPSLGSVRGKIVILDNFSGGSYGLNWNALQLQDDYEVPTIFDIDDKWGKVRSHLEATNSSTSGALYVNFLSGVSGGAYPYTVAGGDGVTLRGVNDYALEYLVEGKAGRTGVMMMDFPGAGLIDTIIAHNFRLLPSSVQPTGDFDTIFKNVAYSFSGDAESRWNQMNTFLHHVLPGRTWHWMALKNPWGAWMHVNGGYLFSRSDSIDGFTHIAFTSRTAESAVSTSVLGAVVAGQLPLLSGGEADRALQLLNYLQGRFPFQSWAAVVKRTPGGLDNWAYTSRGTGYKVAVGDYIYAVWPYSAQDGVYLYEHTNYEGDVRHFTSDNGWLGDLGFNDKVSSLRLIGGYQVQLWRDAYYQGGAWATGQNQSVMPTGLNDWASSLQVWR